MTDREIELKYRVADPAVADALLRAAAIGRFEAAGEVEATELLDRFLDTGDGAFRARRHALRLRTVRDRTTLTIKGPSERVAGGAVSRLELEAIVGGDDPRGWPPSPAHELVDAIAGGRPLREIGRIAQHRRSRLVRSEETRVELSLDEVEVRDGDRTVASWLELEAELRSGDPGRLADLADALVAGGGLEPSPESKLASALRALDADRSARSSSG